MTREHSSPTSPRDKDAIFAAIFAAYAVPFEEFPEVTYHDPFLMSLAAPLDPMLRAPFLRALTIELRRYRPAEITSGLVDRIGHQLLREFSQTSKPKQPVDNLPPLSPLELRRIVSLDEAARLSGLSKATIQRCHSDKIIKLSPRRLGMRIGDALSLRVS